MGKWIEWAAESVQDIDYSDIEGVRIFVPLYDLGKAEYVASLAETCSYYRSKGLKIMLCIDYHVQYPVFHGPPPKWPNPDDSQLGYAPFGWKRGWIWARDQIAHVVKLIWPEAVQMAEEPHVREGWGFYNAAKRPDVAAYNDTMTIYKQALITDLDWDGWFVIPETEGSDVQREGIKRASAEWSEEHVKQRGFSHVYPEQNFNWVSAYAIEPPDEEEDDEDDEIPPDDIPPYDEAMALALKSYTHAQAGRWTKAVRTMRRARRAARGK